MKRIKLVVFFILGLFMLTSCSMFSHESFPSGPQIEEPGTNPDVEVSSYLITYYENGLKVHQESLESGKALPQVESTKAPLGQEFMGWSTSKEEYVPVDFDVMPESDVDLYAFYQKVKYTITFNANISLPDGTTTTKEYEYHDRLGEFVPSDLQEIIDAQTEYVFVGWFLDSEFKEEFVEVSMPAEDIVLYAKWQFSGIRFMNGLEVFYEVKDDEGAAVQAPLQNPTKPGYDFVGWVDAKGNAVSFPLIVTDEVQFIYAESHTLKKGGKDVMVADNSNTPIKYNRVLFDVTSGGGLKKTSIYFYTNGETNYYKLTTIANFDELYKYISNMPMFGE